MTDPDRYDLDLLEPLGAVAPPTPEVLNRVAANLHAHYLQDAMSGGRPATSIRQRTRLALPVAAAAAAVAAVLAVGGADALHSGHRHGPAAISPTDASLGDAILTAFSNTASSISYTQSVWTTAGQKTRVVDVWTSPFEGSTGQSQTRREVVTVGGQTVQDVEMIYALPAPDARVPANCDGQIDSPKPPPIRGQSGGTQATDGRLIDVEYASRSWSDQPDTCLAVTQPADAAQIRSDIASGGWTVLGRDTVDGRPALELSLRGQHGSADLLWVDAQTFLPIRASANKGGAPGADDSLVTTYRFLSATPGNQKNLITPIPAGFTQTAAPPASTHG
ncbi:MAG TPA: hypothetical protein VLL25_16555 [Acidimicrobiales bacterium]|nr:hypothetical protein [Acidimicrobiales bacterium]